MIYLFGPRALPCCRCVFSADAFDLSQVFEALSACVYVFVDTCLRMVIYDIGSEQKKTPFDLIQE